MENKASVSVVGEALVTPFLWGVFHLLSGEYINAGDVMHSINIG